MKITTLREYDIPATKFLFSDKSELEFRLEHTYWFSIPDELEERLGPLLDEAKFQVMEDGEIKIAFPENEVYSISEWLIAAGSPNRQFIVLTKTPRGTLMLMCRTKDGLLDKVRAYYGSPCFEHISDISGIIKAQNK